MPATFPSETAALIAEARSFLGGAGDATLVGRLADALEAAEADHARDIETWGEIDHGHIELRKAAEAERDQLARLHEVATERVVGYAAVMARVEALVNATEPWGDMTDAEWVAALQNILKDSPS